MSDIPPPFRGEHAFGAGHSALGISLTAAVLSAGLLLLLVAVMTVRETRALRSRLRGRRRT